MKQKQLPSKWLALLAGVFFITSGCSKNGEKIGMEVSLDDANRALQMSQMNGQPFPKSLIELTNIAYFQGKHLVTPPPGKKFVLNAADRKILLVND